MSKFTVRTKAPSVWMSLYNNANNGGLSWCIDGRPTNPLNNVLANCVGYACGRFNEIYNEVTGYKGIKYPEFCCNAEDFWKKAKELKLKRGLTPEIGAIMVWEGIGSAAGHVAIVEKVNKKKTVVLTSESGYDSPDFWNSYRTNDGNWNGGDGYKFLGFIYNPAIKTSTKRKTNKQIAEEVIRGEWGVYPQRKKKLEKAGYDYKTIQNIVNKMLS